MTTSANEGQRLALLAQASEALIRSLSLEDTLDTILGLAQDLLGSSAIAIWGYDTQNRKVRLLRSRGLSAKYLETTELDLPADAPDELAGEMAVQDVREDESLAFLRSRYESEGIRSLLVLPLHLLVGDSATLTYYFRTKQTFDPATLSLARAISNLAATALTSARLQEQRETARRESIASASERDRAEIRLRLLSQAGAILNESLDYWTTLSNLTQSVIPELADWCAVHVVENDGVELVAVAHSDPQKVQWVNELREKFPPDPDADKGVFQVIRTGQPEMMAHIPEELIVAAARNDEHLAVIKQLGLRSYVCVPLRTRDSIIGALSLIYAESGRSYDETDLELAEEMGRRAGLAVEKARLFRESEKARQELELSNRAKDEFLGIVSHELRTPLTTIYGSSKLLADRADRLDDEMKADIVSDIAGESSKLLTLMDNLLLLARVELRQPVHKEEIDVREFLERTVRNQRNRVIMTCSPATFPISAEPVFLQQIVSNLVTNAEKYSEADDEIEVCATDHADYAEFVVRDRGPGVAPEELSLIFDSFYRSERTARLPGKGLGLAICKRLIEAQGGTIEARLRTGGGLEVCFTLPHS